MKQTLLTLVFLALAATAIGQTKLIQEGDDAFAAGLYKQALDLYKKAARSHPSTDLTYKMGDAARMAFDYAKAVEYYRAVATTIYHVDYPDCFFHLGMMHKCNGQPDSAAYWLEKYLRSVPGDGPLVARARQEARACDWILDSTAQRQQSLLYAVSQETKNVNTPGSESGALLVADTLLMFSSVQEYNTPAKKGAIDNDLVLMQVYEASTTGPKTGTSRLVTWGLNDKERHTGNVALDTYHWVIYFTRSDAKAGAMQDYASIPCFIYSMAYKDGKWQKAKKVGGQVNQKGSTSTHPAVAYGDNGQITLYFASDRPGGQGGMDIWCATIDEDGKVGPVVNCGPIVNTPGNEITPFYCSECQTLYFSSDWHYGYGGYDIFSSRGAVDQFQEPLNAGPTLNSPANDMYFTINEGRTNQGYFTSNRRGSYFIGDNTCCNDIYRWSAKPRPAPKPKPAPLPTNMKGAVHNLLPISLYFHNDTPDPKSELYTTKVNYFETYNRYMFMRPDYKKAFAKLPAEQRDSIWQEIDNFFDYEVHDNCLAFEQFIELLIEDLRSGKRVNITVEGYASPVHNGKYNQKISQRRVNSIVNQLMDYDHGRLKPFIGSKGEGSLRINEVAYGSSRAAEGVSNSYTDAQASVWSVEASRERRIEILDYQYLEDDSTLITCLRIPSRAQNIGSYKRGERADIQVRIPHSALHQTTLDYINVGNPDVQVIGYTNLTPGRDLVVHLRLDARKADPTVSSFLPLTLRVSGEQVTQTMFLEYSIAK